MLEKKGNSNSDERMDLLDRFREVFPEAEVAYIWGDREFICREWLTYLLIEPMISFRIRIRESAPPSLRFPQTHRDGASTDQISDGQNRFPASIVFAHP